MPSPRNASVIGQYVDLSRAERGACPPGPSHRAHRSDRADPPLVAGTGLGPAPARDVPPRLAMADRHILADTLLFRGKTHANTRPVVFRDHHFGRLRTCVRAYALRVRCASSQPSYCTVLGLGTIRHLNLKFERQPGIGRCSTAGDQRCNPPAAERRRRAGLCRRVPRSRPGEIARRGRCCGSLSFLWAGKARRRHAGAPSPVWRPTGSERVGARGAAVKLSHASSSDPRQFGSFRGAWFSLTRGVPQSEWLGVLRNHAGMFARRKLHWLSWVWHRE